MQVNRIVAAALMSLSAVAMAQELDPSETLQAKNLASQAAASQSPSESRSAVVAELRGLQAQGALKQVGELSGGPVVAPETQVAADGSKTRAEVRAELAQYRATHPLVVGEFSGDRPISAPVVLALGDGEVAQPTRTWAQVRANFAKWRESHREQQQVVGSAD